MPDNGEPDEPPKPDLRYTRRADQGVSIERDMSGSGHLARGDHSKMSNVRFSVQAKPRDYLDPELAALHETPPAPKATSSAPDVTEAVTVVPQVQAPVVAPGVAGRIASVFRQLFGGER